LPESIEGTLRRPQKIVALPGIGVAWPTIQEIIRTGDIRGAAKFSRNDPATLLGDLVTLQSVGP